MTPIHDPSLSTHAAPSPYRPPPQVSILGSLTRARLPSLWTPSPPDSVSDLEPLSSSLAPPWHVRLPTFCGPPSGLGLDCPGRDGRQGKERGGKGQERERKCCVQLLTPLKLTSVCSLSPQSTIFYSMFAVLRWLGVEGGIQRGMENMCSKKR